MAHASFENNLAANIAQPAEFADHLRASVTFTPLKSEPLIVTGAKAATPDAGVVFTNAYADASPPPKSADGGKDSPPAAKAADKKDEVIHQWYGLGPDTGTVRTWHPVTRGEWEKKAHDLAKGAVDRAVSDIEKHTTGTERRKDSEHLITALQHAKAHMTENEFNELIKGLPGRTTGNKIYTDGNNIKVDVPWGRDPTVFDPSETKALPYNVKDHYSTLTPKNFR